MLTAWSGYWINSALVSVSTILVLVELSNFTRIYDMLAKSLLRWKQNIELEHNLQMARCRNRVYISMVLPFILMTDRFSLYPLPLLARVPGMWSVPALIGIYVIYRLLRLLNWRLVHPHGLNPEEKTSMRRVHDNLFIMMTPLMLLIMGLFCFAGASDSTVRAMLYTVGGFFLLLDWVRVCQFLSRHNSRFITFLYLCALEILPLAIMVVPVAVS